MSGKDLRIAAMTAMSFHPSRLTLRNRDCRQVATPEGAATAQIDEAVADALLTEARLADEDAGIYRVSLDAAIEAAAKALCASRRTGFDWSECPEKERHRAEVRATVTAAVMGGAQ